MIELCNLSDYKRDAFFYLFARHITKNHLFKHDQIDNMRHRKGISSYQTVGSNPKMVVSVEIQIPNLCKYFQGTVQFKIGITLTIYASISI